MGQLEVVIINARTPSMVTTRQTVTIVTRSANATVVFFLRAPLKQYKVE
jgi:hypothetical protein